MFKKLLTYVITAALIGIMPSHVAAQSLAVNTSGAAADNSAILDVSSTGKGMLVPRMSKAQKSAIASPATGLLVFQDSPDSIGFHYYDGVQWVWLASSTKIDSTAWLTTGNTGLNDTSFIGHRDNKPINFRSNNIKVGRFDRVRGNYYIGRAAGHDNGGGQIAIGDSAGVNTNNNYPGIYLGYRSGLSNIGNNNTFLGAWAGEKNTTGSLNSFVGTGAGINNLTGSYNSFVGQWSGGNASSGNQNTALGYASMNSVGAGSNNIAIGLNSLYTYQGDNVTAVGTYALDSLTTGTRATAVGYRALMQNTTGDRNTAIGYRSLDSNKVGNYNVGVGYAALFRNRASFNTSVGDNSLASSTTGDANTALGADVMIYNSTGYWNTSTGVNSLFNNTTGYQNTANGFQSLVSNTEGYSNTAAGTFSGSGIKTGAFNIAIGFQSMSYNDSGSNNVAVGVNSMYYHRRPGSSYNTAVGNYSLEQDTSGYYNTALGVSASRNNINSIGNTALGTNAMYYHKYNDYNTAVGFESMFYDSTGSLNTAIGWRSLRYNKNGGENTALGVGAIEFTDSSYRNTAVGRGAMIGGVGTSNLAYNTVMGFYAGAQMDSVEQVTAIGSFAGYRNKGTQNTFVGYNAGNGSSGLDLTGIENTGMGAYTLTYNNTGKSNTAVGLGSMFANRSGNGNIAVGTRALCNATSYSYNIAIGDSAMYGNNANENMAIGTFAMRSNNTGTTNSAVGNYALMSNNTGSGNTALGHQALTSSNAAGNTAVGFSAGSVVTSGTYNTLVGYNADVSTASFTNASAIGAYAQVGQNNSMVLGSINGVNSATATTSVGIGVNTPGARLHIRRSGASGGAFHANSSMIIEDNTQSYVQLSNPNASENGILSGNASTSIRSGIVFSVDSSVYLRSGGNSTRMTIDNTGYVGIGTTAPITRLHIAESAAANVNLRVSSVNSSWEPGVELTKGGGGVDWKIYNSSSNLFTLSRSTDDFVTPTDYYEWGVSAYRPVNDATISLGQSTFRWTTVYATNGVINTSDARDKENIENLGYGLKEIMKLRPVIFNWKQNPQWGKKIGFIAQEVKPVLNEVVQVGNLETKSTKDADDKTEAVDKLGIYYSDIIPVAVKAIQEQQQMIEKQAKENAELKEKNAQLEKEIQLIKQKLGL